MSNPKKPPAPPETDPFNNHQFLVFENAEYLRKRIPLFTAPKGELYRDGTGYKLVGEHKTVWFPIHYIVVDNGQIA